VARRAAEILDTIEADADYPRFGHATLAHLDYATFTGFPIVANFDLDKDGPALFVDAMRVMALKAAVYELTRDEQRAELLVPAPVDEMIHAAVAQFTLLARIQARTGVDFVHAPDLKRFDYDTRCYTDLAYEAAGWGTPNPRYWIGQQETARRLGLLRADYEAIGIFDFGRHEHDFEATARRENDLAGHRYRPRGWWAGIDDAGPA